MRLITHDALSLQTDQWVSRSELIFQADIFKNQTLTNDDIC